MRFFGGLSLEETAEALARFARYRQARLELGEAVAAAGAERGRTRMTPERWRQVEDLCHAALARAVDERAAFLAAACAGDDALQREVESLLAQETGPRDSCSAPAAPVASGRARSGEGHPRRRRLGATPSASLLGVGGMGEVYRAHDDTLGREVAIKVLPPAFTADPERRARFEREARMLATLNHPHIGAIYGVEEADGVRGLVLELVEGETLAERIAARRTPAFSWCCRSPTRSPSRGRSPTRSTPPTRRASCTAT